MAFLELRNLSKSYGSGTARTEVLRDLDLEVERGELVAILGYSGTGKTTLMSMLAGLIEPDTGEVLHDDERVKGPSGRRGLVFQNYSLLPWLTVEGNVALSVNRLFAREPADKRRKRVLEAVELVNLTPALHKKPAELSGGMRQRTSVARTLACRPEVLLLDEPLSALDALTRSVIQDQILEIREKLGQTILLITNDVDEGLYMADRIIPLSMGPGATFGPEVVVDMPRPRDRTAMNHDEAYKAKRRQIIEYLLEQKRAYDAPNGEAQSIKLPDARPIDPADLGRNLLSRLIGRRIAA